MKIVFIRIDKIGDLIATLPVDQIPELKNHQTSWVISKGLGNIVKACVSPRKFIELDAKDKVQAFKDLKKHLQQEQPDMVISFYSPWWVGLACFLAGVKTRVTRYSQWHSFLFFNKGLRQSRSLGEKHESEYNLDLVNLGLERPLKPGAPTLSLKAPLRRQLFEKFDLQPSKYIIVHPGMAGSALNWPQSCYNQLIEKLVQKTVVVITGTPADSPFLTEIKPRWELHKNVRFVQNQLTMDDLLVVINSATAVIAPSTGVLHIAASLGRPSLGLFSPIPTHHPRRWGPRGPVTEVFIPNVSGLSKSEVEKLDNGYMANVSVDHVFSKVEKYLS